MSFMKVLCQISLLVSALYVTGLLIRAVRLGTDTVLGAQLEEADLRALKLTSLMPPHLSKTNPWRGAGRRWRRDLLTSIPGCGGTFKQAIAQGSIVQLKYSTSKNGQIVDNSSKSVSVVAGTRQVPIALDMALFGLCAGEAILVKTKDSVTMLFIEQVGDQNESDEERLLNGIARTTVAVPGKRGNDCVKECRRRGLECNDKAFGVVNNCPRLRELFECDRCEIAAVGSAGPDMPAFVLKTAPKGHARGACLVSPTTEWSTCRARYVYTKRLCPCSERNSVLQNKNKML